MQVSIVKGCSAPKKPSNNLNSRKEFEISPYACDSFQKVSFGKKMPFLSEQAMNETAQDIKLYANNAAREILEGSFETAKGHLNHAAKDTIYPEIHFLRGYIEHGYAIGKESFVANLSLSADKRRGVLQKRELLLKKLTEEKNNNPQISPKKNALISNLEEESRTYKEVVSLIPKLKEEILGHHAKALEHYEKAVERSRSNQRIFIAGNIRKAEVHALQGDVPKALISLGSALKSRNEFNPHIEIEPESLIELTQPLIMPDSNSMSMAYRAEAIFHFSQKNAENASDSLSSSLGYNRKSAESHFLKGKLAEFCAFSKDPKYSPDKAFYLRTAEKCFNKALKFSKGVNIEVLKKRAEFYKVVGKNRKALKDYKKILKLEPQNQEARVSEGVMYMLLNKKEHAIRDFDLALKQNPTDKFASFCENCILIGRKIDKKFKSKMRNLFVKDMYRKIGFEINN